MSYACSLCSRFDCVSGSANDILNLGFRPTSMTESAIRSEALIVRLSCRPRRLPPFSYQSSRESHFYRCCCSRFRYHTPRSRPSEPNQVALEDSPLQPADSASSTAIPHCPRSTSVAPQRPRPCSVPRPQRLCLPPLAQPACLVRDASHPCAVYAHVAALHPPPGSSAGIVGAALARDQIEAPIRQKERRRDADHRLTCLGRAGNAMLAAAAAEE